MNLVKELQYTQPSKYSLRAVSTYFDDGDLYVKGFSSEDQDHPWELSEIVREIRYILRVWE
jgi:hypothetical protein